MAGHAPPDHLRCTYVKATGSRCSQTRVDPGSEENTWCEHHITFALNGVRHAGRTRSSLESLLHVNPLQVLLDEIKRSQMLVAWYTDSLERLEPEDAMLVRITESRVGGPGGDYELVREEQRPHPVLTLLRDERAHLANCTRMAIQSGIEVKQLELSQAMAATVITAMTALARRLGLDPNEANVRRMIAEAMREARDGEALALTAGPDGPPTDG